MLGINAEWPLRPRGVCPGISERTHAQIMAPLHRLSAVLLFIVGAELIFFGMTQGCYLTYTELKVKVSGFSGPDCNLCHCVKDASCNYNTGTCLQGCNRYFLGYNCRTEFKYPFKPTITNVTTNNVTVSWRTWNETVDSLKGKTTVTYGVVIEKAQKKQTLPVTSTPKDGILTHTLGDLEPDTQYTVCIELYRPKDIEGGCKKRVLFRTLKGLVSVPVKDGSDGTTVQPAFSWVAIFIICAVLVVLFFVLFFTIFFVRRQKRKSDKSSQVLEADLSKGSKGDYGATAGTPSTYTSSTQLIPQPSKHDHQGEIPTFVIERSYE